MKIIYEIIWRLIALIHFVFVIGNIVSIFILPFMVEWYLWIPLDSFLVNLLFNRAFKDCPITACENVFRKLAGRRQIKSFVGSYIFSPVRRLYRKFK